MQVKDYYKILEVNPGATEYEIRKNFRRLALRYHPDTNQGNQHAQAWYREIQEAYEVLTDPKRKAGYLQQRWLVKAGGKRFATAAPITTPSILQMLAMQAHQVRAMDHFRLDHIGLKNQVSECLSEEVEHHLATEANEAELKEAVNSLLQCLEPLKVSLLPELLTRLQRMTASHPQVQAHIIQWRQNRQRQHRWEKYQPWVYGALAILLCLLVFALTR